MDAVWKKSGQDFSDHAYWIWANAAQEREWWMFRKAFHVPADDCRAQLLVTAGTYHVTYLNGALLARGPGRSYDFAKGYDVIDVTPYLRPGSSNVLAILSVGLEHPGILAELRCTASNGATFCVATDQEWKTQRHAAFQTDLPRNAILIGQTLAGVEECFDARQERIGWNLPDFDDKDWTAAEMLGAVGMPPWLKMEQSRIGLMAHDPQFPKAITAIELAGSPPGYRFRLAAAKGANIFASEIQADAPAAIRLRFKYEGGLASKPPVALHGQRINPDDSLTLPAGATLFCCYHQSLWSDELELLIETDARLSFSARSILAASADEWAACSLPAQDARYPWHDSNSAITAKTLNLAERLPDVASILAAPTAQEMPESVREKFAPVRSLTPSIYQAITAQDFYNVPGGVSDPVIEQGQPRLTLADEFSHPVRNPHNLLHAHADASVIMPPPGGKAVHIIVDFDAETVGYLQIALDAPEGAIIDAHGFEIIDGHGVLWLNNHNNFRYICREGSQTFTSHYRRGFRYVSITMRNVTRPILFKHVCCLSGAYPVRRIGHFSCSDAQLNAIYEMSVETAAACMLDTYVDCPGHEQNYWVGDARVTALINLLTFGAYDFNQQSIRLVGQSLSPEWAQAYYPDDERYASGRALPIAAFPNYPEGGLPIWTFQWMLQCWEHYLHGGNRDDLAENYGYVAETLRRCQRLTNERGLFELPGAWNLIEWANNDLAPYGEATANNALLAACYRCAAKMAETLGEQAAAQAYTQAAAALVDAINASCWDDERRAYVDTVRDQWAYQRYGAWCRSQQMTPESWERYASCARISEQTNTLALLCDCVPPERLAAVENIARRVTACRFIYGAPAGRSYGSPSQSEAPDGIVAIGSPFFLFFSLAALSKLGQSALLPDVMRRAWGPMVAQGTRTFWETFQFDAQRWTRSVCHAWAAAPAIYLPAAVLGIRPVAPGFRQFAITPELGDLAWARGAVATPYGPINVNVRRNAHNELDITWSAPQECERIVP